MGPGSALASLACPGRRSFGRARPSHLPCGLLCMGLFSRFLIQAEPLPQGGPDRACLGSRRSTCYKFPLDRFDAPLAPGLRKPLPMPRLRLAIAFLAIAFTT